MYYFDINYPIVPMAAVWWFEFYSKFWNINWMISPGVKVNMSKNTEAITFLHIF